MSSNTGKTHSNVLTEGPSRAAARSYLRRAGVRMFAVLLICGSAFAQAPIPKNGFVPDETTAVRIAEAVLSPIYGEEQIKSERPFHGKLKAGVWTISGTLPPDSAGGVAVIRIDQHTGAILSFIHYK